MQIVFFYSTYVFSLTESLTTHHVRRSVYHIPDQQVVFYGNLFRYKLPFNEPSFNNIKSVDAYTVPHGPLPPWLEYNPVEYIFRGIPTITDIGEIRIKILITYRDSNEVESKIFNIVVLPGNKVTLNEPIKDENITENGYDLSCRRNYPPIMLIFFNTNYNFLSLYSKIDLITKLSLNLKINIDEIKMITAEEFKNYTDDVSCGQKSSQSNILERIYKDQLAVQLLLKFCENSCKEAEKVYNNVLLIDFDGIELFHWVVYDLKENSAIPPPLQNDLEKSSIVPDNSLGTPITSVQNSQPDKRPELKTTYPAQYAHINSDYMFKDVIYVYVGEIISIPISPYLVINEKVYTLRQAQQYYEGYPFSTPHFNEWVRLINNETTGEDSTSRIVIIGLQSMIGNHTLCLVPSLIENKCLKFSIVVKKRLPKMELNHAVLLDFNFAQSQFERSMEVKMNLIGNIIATAYPNKDKQHYKNFRLNSYKTTESTMLRLNVSLNDFYASLCRVEDEIEDLFSNFVKKRNSFADLSDTFLQNCKSFSPVRAELELFGPCAPIKLQSVNVPAIQDSQDAQSGNIIKVDISTVLLVSILAFIVLVVIGISIVFFTIFMNSQRTESIYGASTFTEMRPKMPTIFPNDLNDNHSSRSSSPSRLYSLLATSKQTSCPQPPPFQPTITVAVSSSRSPDSIHCRNSFGSNRSDPSQISNQPFQPPIFECITEVANPPRSSSVASPTLNPNNNNNNPKYSFGTPDLLISSPKPSFYDVPNLDSPIRFGSYQKPKVETTYSTVTLPRSPHAVVGIRKRDNEYQNKEEVRENCSEQNERCSTPDSQEFLQFRPPSPLPTQILLMQAKVNSPTSGDSYSPNIVSHRFC